MYGDQGSAAADAFGKSLRVLLFHAGICQCSGKPTRNRSDACSCQRRRQRPGRNDGADSRDCQCAQAHQQARQPPEDGAHTSASSGIGSSIGAADALGALALGVAGYKADIVTPEAAIDQVAHRFLCGIIVIV
jgi:hypothetical protein